MNTTSYRASLSIIKCHRATVEIRGRSMIYPSHAIVELSGIKHSYFLMILGKLIVHLSAALSLPCHLILIHNTWFISTDNTTNNEKLGTDHVSEKINVKNIFVMP
ncbi:hypothetical protein FRX31_002790 [Thalictrum thalictroides]|uniref:Uncharacterized protein n=1 Tax=Thalictrum thalictroides TaxID=46969 RepID=A0A7J6XCV0_THATH|nr:hypothetical protein FRX31_002790 [Thalictrum thalictroides]